MFELNEAVRGRLISPKTYDRIDKIFERKNGAARDCPTLCLGDLILHPSVNPVLMGLRPEMAVKPGFTK